MAFLCGFGICSHVEVMKASTPSPPLFTSTTSHPMTLDPLLRNRTQDWLALVLAICPPSRWLFDYLTIHKSQGRRGRISLTSDAGNQ